MPPRQLYISKRVFGPPMSPSIFQHKWLSKFRILYHEASNGEMKPTKFAALEAASHLSKQFEHLNRFDLESQALRLQKTDFPTVSEANIEAASNNQDEYERKNGPGYMTDNPFAIAAQFTLWLDWYLERFQEMKLGTELDGVRWRNLPIDVRGRINDILEIRAKQVEWGLWPITEEIREVVFKKSENGD
ncbi:hypothetical protein PRZ48_013551 [Zasmidium cellare]|uniref:Uncharacterized protein n=1 Tax=Zasmidium cellare TaxID=395010 RepID=A0ABR0E1C3_ZASCE|nr:hypothetical protein PRZ48_013551 [Zasmidium cellare]